MTDRDLRRFLLLIIATLIGLGCIAVYSSTAIMAYETYGRSLHFVVSHLLAVAVGLGLSLLCLAVPYARLRAAAKPLVVICLVLLVMVLIFGSEAGGARRWFRLGRFGIQPSEFAQLALVIYVSDYLARKHEVIQDFRQGFLPPMLITALMAGLTLLQPDLGTAIVMGAVALLLLVAAKARWRHIGLVCVVGALALAVLVCGQAYRRRRMLAFLHPWEDPQGVGFQIVQSYIAMGSGGLVGRGIGASLQKLFFLPDAHTDFIFAVIGEELGLLGTTAVIGLYGLFALSGLRMAVSVEDRFSKYLICGCVGLIGVEALINMAVVTGLMPTKGLPLPLVSYGGTAMVSNCLACALILQASRRRVSVRE
ncbi:MAG: putative lipid II flippase FtsW [Candidatus Omnitrophica bacterium]|nr:putative lipid II flippase FtsW [Candidatus Omnitrophota bacterium]